MRILVCGADGFIGRHLRAHLAVAGHTVLCGRRRPQNDGDIGIDFAAPAPAAWAARLAGCDALVNCAGILVEGDGARYAAIHDDGPRALFEACVAAGVGRVVQVSALGAGTGRTPYFASKRAADEALMRLPLAWQIVRPALVYGADGVSAGFFRALASLPVLPLPGGGKQIVQPIHIDDLCAAIAKLLDPATPAGQCIELVGARPLSLRELLLGLRRAMGLPPAHCLTLPSAIMGLAARVAGRWPGSLLTPDTWRMLQAGNRGNPAPTAALLGRPPRPSERFIAPDEAAGARLAALAAWRGPLLRGALAFVWLVTGLVSLFVHPHADSLAWLARAGLPGQAGWPALIGAAGLDLALGWATLAHPGRRLWLAQMALIAVYSLIVAACLPEFLGHPFGPLSKNLPILALLAVLYAEEKRA